MKNQYINFLTRFFFSTSHKDIGTLYIVFGLFAGLIGSVFSVLIRMELSYPGNQFFSGDYQFYINICFDFLVILKFIFQFYLLLV